MSCRNSDNDTGTFQNSDIPSFEIQTEDMDNPPYRALLPPSSKLSQQGEGGGGGDAVYILL